MELPPKTNKKIERPEIDSAIVDSLTAAMKTVIEVDPQPLLGGKEAEEVQNGQFRRLDLETAPPDSMSITVASYFPGRRVYMAERVREETSVDIDAPLGHVGFHGAIGNTRIGGAVYIADTTAVAWVKFSLLNPFGRPADDSFGTYRFADAVGVTELWARFICDKSKPVDDAHIAGLDDLEVIQLTRTLAGLVP